MSQASLQLGGLYDPGDHNEGPAGTVEKIKVTLASAF